MKITSKFKEMLEAYKAYRIASRRAYRQARLDHYKATNGRHPCAARGTATKNTKRNIWNVRAPKSQRLETRFLKLRAFKVQYSLA